jgi:hypothetical protein
MGVSQKVTLDKDQKYTIGYSFKNKMGISANNFVLLELIKDGSIMYTRKLQATEATTFDYTAPATGEYTWRMRSSSIGTTTTQPLTYSLDNLSIFYSYPYTVENCDNLADGYRFGFNTQEKDDEVYGAGNLNTAMFWEYDTRIGRRWNTDPVVKVWESPYLVNGGNPIFLNDPNGDVYGISTKKDKDGNLTEVKISATVFIKGDGASEKRAKELTKAARKVYKTETVDGVKVSFDVQYKYDPNKKPEDLNAKLGENLLTFSSKEESKTNRSHISGFIRGIIQYTGNTGVVFGSGKGNYTTLHETLHFLGLSDRYNSEGNPHVDYDKDIMGVNGEMALRISHYQNIVEYVQNQLLYLTPKFPNLKYIYSNKILDLKYEKGRAKLKR